MSGIFILLKDHTFPIQAVLSPLARRGHCVVRNLSHGSLQSTLQFSSEDLSTRGFSHDNIELNNFLKYGLLCNKYCLVVKFFV